MKILKLKNAKEVSILTKGQLKSIEASIDLDCEDPNIPLTLKKTLCYDPDAECIDEI